MVLKLETTKTGMPGIWETSKSGDFLKQITIISNGDYTPKSPIFITRATKAIKHALFVAEVGDLIYKATVGTNESKTLYCITEIKENAGKFTAICDEITNLFNQNDLDTNSQKAAFVTALNDKISNSNRVYSAYCKVKNLK